MKNFSLKAKVLALSSFLVLISIIIGGVGHWSLGKVKTKYSVITDTSFPNTTVFLQMFSNYRVARIEGLQLVSDFTSKEQKLKSIEGIQKAIDNDQNFHKKYMGIEFLPGEEPLYTEFRKHIDQSYLYLKTLLELSAKNSSGIATPEMNDLMFVKIMESGNSSRVAMEKLRDFHFGAAEVAEQEAKEASTFATQLSIGLIMGLGAFGLFAAFIFSNSLIKSLKEISDALDESSTQVSSAAGQIASSSEELSQAATEQAASLEETSASVEEMSSMVNINSENAKKASENSGVSKRQAERGRAVVEEMVISMSQINESNNNIMNQINQSNEQMGEIVKVIQEIETKTKVINDIVFQTKLLSFNASVEAARAGEQGKGFAVVAEEVGNLAQMSGNAAKEISDMLAASVHKVETIVHETKTKVDVLITDGKEKIKNGNKIAEECGGVLAEIVTNVTGVATMASEISNASDEQSKGIQEITKAMGLLDQVTQTNSATSEEAASAAGELSAQADSLKSQVRTLIGVINGKVVEENDFTPKSGGRKPAHTPIHKAPTNVLPMKKAVAASRVSTPQHHQQAPMKKAAGGSARDGLPNYNHPGFEEV